MRRTGCTDADTWGVEAVTMEASARGHTRRTKRTLLSVFLIVALATLLGCGLAVLEYDGLHVAAAPNVCSAWDVPDPTWVWGTWVTGTILGGAVAVTTVVVLAIRFAVGGYLSRLSRVAAALGASILAVIGGNVIVLDHLSRLCGA